MTTTDPTPLAEQIAREHRALLNTSTWLIVGCACDPALTAPANGAAGSWYAAHIATVTERALKAEWHPALSRISQVLDALVMDTPEDQRMTDRFADTLRRLTNLTEAAHAVTEQAVRERVAEEIEREAGRRDSVSIVAVGLRRAARIARGEEVPRD